MGAEVGRVCPHCSYKRKAQEFAPPWQCPACGNQYESAAGGADQAWESSRASSKAESAQAGGLALAPSWVWSFASSLYMTLSLLIFSAFGYFFSIEEAPSLPGYFWGIEHDHPVSIEADPILFSVFCGALFVSAVSLFRKGYSRSRSGDQTALSEDLQNLIERIIPTLVTWVIFSAIFAGIFYFEFTSLKIFSS